MTRAEGRQFLRAIWNLSNGRLLPGLMVTVLAGFTEGLSLMLLVPLVALAAPGGESMAGHIPLIGGVLARYRPDIGMLLALFVLLVALQALLTRWKTVFNQRTLQMISERLRINLFEAMSLSRWEAIQQKRAGDLNHALTNDVDRIIGATGSALALFQSLFMLGVYVLLAAAVSWQMAGFAILVGGALFAMLYPMRRRAVRHGKDLVAMYQAQNATVIEFVTGIRLAKLFTVESRQVKEYGRHLRAIRTAIVRYAGFSTWSAVAFQIGTAAIAALFVWLAVTVYALELPRLALLLIIFARLAPRFSSIQENSQLFLSEATAFAHYRTQASYFHRNREAEAPAGAAPPQLRRALRLERVSVAYASSPEPSLDDVSIEIAAGKVTALIGPSGSGKSTLADIVLGLIRPTSGTVTIDGEAIDEGNRRAWRASLASVPQDAFLLNDTIAENLRIGQASATDEELWAALEEANVADLVHALPGKLDTLAGERGARFSGGERQRLALARALLRKPQLLVLDEATSALDWENQRMIAAAIAGLRGQLTILTIAHRPSLIAFADEVVTLAAGRVAERGSYADLKARPSSALARMLAAEGGA